MVKRSGGATATQPLYSTAEAARKLGVDGSRIRQLAIELGIGTKFGARAWMFSEEDLDTMKTRTIGGGARFGRRPSKVQG